MFKLPTKISHHHHRHILRRTAPPGTRILSTTHAPAQPKTPKSILEANSYREIPSKDDVNPTSKENTQSGTHDEIAHTNEAAYGPNTNPVEERAMAATEKTDGPGNPLEISSATPEVSCQPEDKSPEVGKQDRSKASGGKRRNV